MRRRSAFGKKAKQLGDPCKDCGRTLTLFNCHMKSGRVQTCCSSCEKLRDAKRPSRTTEARGEYYREWKFGVKPDDYSEKLKLQLGGCAICRQPCSVRGSLAVDHNHVTGAVRDLLCHRCNVVLGLVGEDDLLLHYMIDYLKKHAENVA